MKTLQESIQKSLNEDYAYTLAAFSTLHKKDADSDGIIMFKKPIEIGENDAQIEGIDTEGRMLVVAINRSSDKISVKNFSDDCLEKVIGALKALK